MRPGIAFAYAGRYTSTAFQGCVPGLSRRRDAIADFGAADGRSALGRNGLDFSTSQLISTSHGRLEVLGNGGDADGGAGRIQRVGHVGYGAGCAPALSVGCLRSRSNRSNAVMYRP